MIGRIWRTLLAAASIRFWAMVGASMALTIFAAWLVWLVAYRWAPLIEAGRRIDILGKALWIVLGGVIAVVFGLIGKHVEVSGIWGRLNVSGDDPVQPPAPATVTTTTTKTETAP